LSFQLGFFDPPQGYVFLFLPGPLSLLVIVYLPLSLSSFLPVFPSPSADPWNPFSPCLPYSPCLFFHSLLFTPQPPFSLHLLLHSVFFFILPLLDVKFFFTTACRRLLSWSRSDSFFFQFLRGGPFQDEDSAPLAPRQTHRPLYCWLRLCKSSYDSSPLLRDEHCVLPLRPPARYAAHLSLFSAQGGKSTALLAKL